MTAMHQISARPDRADAGRGPFPGAVLLSAADRHVLRRLRRMARQAQLSSPIAIDHACSLIAPSGPDEYGLALMRTLNAVALRPVNFHPVGAEETTFDELWLMRLLRCLQAGDVSSARLLIDTRTQRIGRRAVAFLAQGLAARLMDDTLETTRG